MIKFFRFLIYILLFAHLIISCKVGEFSEIEQYADNAESDTSGNSITSFIFTTPAANGVISGNNISVTVPFGTVVTSLVPAITHTGASINPPAGAPQDFTFPVVYTVTAADSSTQIYTVTVTVALNSAKEITFFNITSPVTASGTIAGLNISVEVPFGTDVTALVPNIIHTGASINPPSGVPQNFTAPVVYMVTADDSSMQNYTVTVTVLPNPAATVITTPIVGNLAFTVDIYGTSARGGGDVTDQGGSPVTARGLCWDTTPNPTIFTGTVMASASGGTGVYSDVLMTGLTENTLYYVRAYATNSDGTAYGSQITFNSGWQFSNTVFQGGYVFYNDGLGGGLISSPADQGASQVWIEGGATQTTLNGSTLEAIGTGQANTTAIIAQTGHTGSAAALCDAYDDGTYTDWYLPSRDELILMYGKLKSNLIGGFSDVFYWNSSESNATNANCYDFSSGMQGSFNKGNMYNVRAVRSF